MKRWMGRSSWNMTRVDLERLDEGWMNLEWD